MAQQWRSLERFLAMASGTLFSITANSVATRSHSVCLAASEEYEPQSHPEQRKDRANDNRRRDNQKTEGSLQST
jgi:hypothetical protein